jgi:hypothetical protein
LKSSAAPLDYDIIFDDDGPGEVADIVAMAERSGFIIIHLFHCKYSVKSSPGARQQDVYVLCGQAQVSVQWRSNLQRLFSHLIHRDVDRCKNGGVTRFEKGTRKGLLKLQRKTRSLGLRPPDKV